MDLLFGSVNLTAGGGNLYGMKMEKWQVCDSGSYEGMDVQDPVSNWGYCDSWDAPVVNLTQN